MNVKGIMGGDDRKRNNNWVVKEDNSDHDSTSIGTFSEDSMNSLCSSSSELNEDASSSSSSSPSTSSHNSNGSLYDLSELMNHLPIKRGLSMFYEGKAQSFTSLSGIQSIEELPKKSISYSKRMKSCKSYGGCLDSHRIMYSPKATISKKPSRGPFASMLNKRANLLEASRLSIAAQKNF